MLFPLIMISSELAARAVVQACVCEEGKVPSTPKYWNGYFGAARLTAFEYWSPLGGARQTSVASAPSVLACDLAFGTSLWEQSLAAVRTAGVEVTPDGVIS